MHLSTNFGKEIREKKTSGTNGLTSATFTYWTIQKINGFDKFNRLKAKDL